MTAPTHIDPRLRAVTLTPFILRQPASELGPAERLLIAVVAYFGDTTFPPRETLAALMGCSVRTAGETIKTLIERDWLSVEKRRSEHGMQLPSRYLLHVPKRLEPEAVSASGPRADSAVTGGENCPLLNSDSISEKDSEKKELRPAGATPSFPSIPEPEKPKPAAPPPPQPKKAVHPDTPAALSFVLEFHAALEKMEGKKPPPTVMGRDIKMIRPLIGHYGREMLTKMAEEFFRYRVAKGYAMTVPGFVYQAENLFHYATKREEGTHGNAHATQRY